MEKRFVRVKRVPTSKTLLCKLKILKYIANVQNTCCGGVRDEKPSSRVHFTIFGHAKHNRNYVLQGKEKKTLYDMSLAPSG
jgi:hypothetical protein